MPYKSYRKIIQSTSGYGPNLTSQYSMKLIPTSCLCLPPHSLSQTLSLYLCVCVCVCVYAYVCVCVCHNTHVDVRDKSLKSVFFCHLQGLRDQRVCAKHLYPLSISIASFTFFKTESQYCSLGLGLTIEFKAGHELPENHQVLPQCWHTSGNTPVVAAASSSSY